MVTIRHGVECLELHPDVTVHTCLHAVIGCRFRQGIQSSAQLIWIDGWDLMEEYLAKANILCHGSVLESYHDALSFIMNVVGLRIQHIELEV